MSKGKALFANFYYKGPAEVYPSNIKLYCPVCQRLQQTEIVRTLVDPGEAKEHPAGWTGEINHSTVCRGCRTILMQQTSMGWLEKENK